jgi:putative FmdB family regulatory protein
MPFYEYQCTNCGYEEEVLQKISDKPLKKCPQCGKSTMKKKVSAAAFRLKGGGWYETDFKSGNKKNVAGEAKADSPKDASAKEASAKEAKPQDNARPAAPSKTPAASTKAQKVKHRG